MPLNDIIITKLSGGLGRRYPEQDMVSGFITQGIAVPGGVQLFTSYRLKSLDDALLLGINKNYDTTNNLLVYEHIKEFFRVNPSGELWIYITDLSVSYGLMLDPALTNSAKKLLADANGTIRQLGVVDNQTGGNWTNTLNALTQAQVLATYQYNLHAPCEIILEGKYFNFPIVTNLRTLNSPNVSVMVGQDKSIASTYPDYAAVGTLLGTISKARVNECVGWVGKFNILGDTLQVPSIANQLLSNISTGDMNTLNDYGYIYFRTHTGRPGIYFNDSHTCTDVTDDYAFIENNRTIHKAIRNIRTALLPRLASPILVDPDTGKLNPEVCKSIESDGKRALETMLSEQEISGLDVFVDPDQNILANNELQVQFSIIPTGTARQIKVTIGFENPF